MVLAIITGARGQDGTYLRRLLASKGYAVVAFTGDVRDAKAVDETIRDHRLAGRIEVYNLAGKIHGCSPTEAFEVNTVGLLNILESVRANKLQSVCRIFQASSAEIFGAATESPQTEETACRPRSVYGLTKMTGHWLIRLYRENHGLYACSGIMYTHESPMRTDAYVTGKIVAGLRSGEPFTLGNLDSVRDWGHAEDYAEAMWLALQQDRPDDYVVATGKTHTVREFARMAAEKMGKVLAWRGDVGLVDGVEMITVSPEFYRPREAHALVGDPSKLEALGWIRKHDIHSVIEDMVLK